MVLWMALPLAAEELVQIDPLSGLPETLQIESFSSLDQRSALKIWLTDAFRYQNARRSDAIYISSRQWREYAASYETDEFRSKISENVEPVTKGEQLLQDALKNSGYAEQIREDGSLILPMPENYESLKVKPVMTELFLHVVDVMAHGYSSPQFDRCGQEYGCILTIRFVPGSLEPESVEAYRTPLSGISELTEDEQLQQMEKQ